MSLEDYDEENDPRSRADEAGQSGDLQGLHGEPNADVESVEELIEEGQYNEAAFVDGIENAPNADEGGVRTRQVRVDDVPLEYLQED